MNRVAVVTGAAVGHGAGRRPAPRERREPRSRCSTSTATPPSRAADETRRRRAHARSARPVDVADRAAVDDAIAKVRRELGPIEIMVTSAGLDEFQSFTDITRRARGIACSRSTSPARSTACRP